MALTHNKTPQVEPPTGGSTSAGCLLVFFILAMVLIGAAGATGVVVVFCFGVLAAFIMALGSFSSSDAIKEAGSKGEKAALSKLEANLPNGYHIFTNIQVHERMESDMVVVGPTGVFILEVKNYNGEIEGSETDKTWTLHKTGRRGGEYSKDLQNPLGQLRRNIYILSQYFKIKKCPVWVDGYVVFPNSDTTWVGGRVPDKCLDSKALSHLGAALSRLPVKKDMTQQKINQINTFLLGCQGTNPAMTKAEFEQKSEQIKAEQQLRRRRPARK